MFSDALSKRTVSVPQSVTDHPVQTGAVLTEGKWLLTERSQTWEPVRTAYEQREGHGSRRRDPL